MLKRDNQSEKHLVVGSLEVIGEITNSGIKTIKRTVNSLNTSVSEQMVKVEDYWTNIASDKTVTPEEKKTLKKEWNSIESTFAAIYQSIRGSEVEGSETWREYKESYDKLEDYLFNQIKVFDRMTDNTLIDPEEFSAAYESYYSNLQKMQIAIMEGIGTKTVNTVLENLPSKTPRYKGPYYLISKIKEDMAEGTLNGGDWLMWGAETIPDTEFTESGRLVKAYLYRAVKVDGAVTWTELDVADPENAAFFMAALEDILRSQEAGTGYFSTVFSQSFFANSAAIESLQTKTITLQADGGIVKTDDYDGEVHGFRFMSDAYAEIEGIEYPIDFRGATHLGGRCLIDGDALFRGRIECRGGTFSDECIFQGSIESGPLQLLNTPPAGKILEFPAWWSPEVFRQQGYTSYSKKLNPDYSFVNGRAITSLSIEVYYVPYGEKTRLRGYFSWGYRDGGGYFIEKYDNEVIGVNITASEATEGTKTMKLFDLPTTLPNEKGTVWNDNGTLKVKT